MVHVQVASSALRHLRVEGVVYAMFFCSQQFLFEETPHDARMSTHRKRFCEQVYTAIRCKRTRLISEKTQYVALPIFKARCVVDNIFLDVENRLRRRLVPQFFQTSFARTYSTLFGFAHIR